MSVTVASFGDLFRLERRDPGFDDDASLPEIGIRSFGRGVFHKPAVTRDEVGTKRVFAIREGDLLISNIFAWEGAIAIAEGDDDGAIGSHRFMTWTPKHPGVFTPFVRDYLLTSRGLTAIGQASPGSAGRNRTLSVKALTEIKIPLPDLETQRVIAARLDTVAQGSEAAITLVTSRDGVAGLAPRLVSVTLDRLGLPLVPVGDLYHPVSDVVQPGDAVEDADRFVGLQHVVSHVGIRRGQGSTLERTGRKLRFAKGDVLYGYLRPYLNKVWVADGPGLCSVEQYVLRPTSGVDARLLGHVLRQQATLDAVNEATHRLQLPRIRSALLAQIKVPDIRKAPPGLAERLDAVNERSVRLIDLVDSSRRLASSLLPAARNEEFARLLGD